MSITDLNSRITKLFHNPNINFFIIMNLILLIACYTFIAAPIKNTISAIISNPIVILFTIIIIIIIGYYSINIAVLLLILFFIALYGIEYNNSNNYNSNILNTIERFKSSDGDSDGDDDSEKSEDEKQYLSRINNLNIKAQDDKKTDERVNGIKNIVLNTLNKFKTDDDSDYKRSILENKKIIYNQEKQNNNRNNRNSNNRNSNNRNSSKDNFKNILSAKSGSDLGNKNTKQHKLNTKSKDKFINTKGNKAKADDDDYNDAYGNGNGNDDDNDNDNGDGNDYGNISSRGGGRDSNYQTVKPRTFDPSNEEDTNLLITKEVLQDMSNRIEYNYETNKYLKKYIKHRVEEIVDMNNLLDE
jgi:hypothetical protein